MAAGTMSTGDVITTTLDFDAGTLTFKVKGTTVSATLDASQLSKTWYPCACSTLSSGSVELGARSGHSGGGKGSLAAAKASVSAPASEGEAAKAATLKQLLALWTDTLRDVVVRELSRSLDLGKCVCVCR